MALLAIAGPTMPAASAAPKVRVGVALSSPGEVPAYISRVVKPDYVDLYVAWSRAAPFDTTTARWLQSRDIGYKVT